MLIISSVAFAYSLSGTAWPPEAFPLEVRWTGEVQGWTGAEVDAAMQGATAAWSEAGPCEVVLQAVEDPTVTAQIPEQGVAVVFGELEGGLSGLASTNGSTGETFSSGDYVFTVASPTLIQIHSGEMWATDAAIDAGQCDDARSLQGMLTHILGNVLGLDISCSGDDCTDAELEATMYWEQPPCNTDHSSLGSDDYEGFAEIYGAEVTLSCNSVEPMTVTCTATVAGDEVPSWDWGDGQTDTGLSVSHTYVDQGTYTITSCAQSAACAAPRCQSTTFGAWEYSEDAPPEETGGCGGSKSSAGLIMFLPLFLFRRSVSCR